MTNQERETKRWEANQKMWERRKARWNAYKAEQKNKSQKSEK